MFSSCSFFDDDVLKDPNVNQILCVDVDPPPRLRITAGRPFSIPTVFFFIFSKSWSFNVSVELAIQS